MSDANSKPRATASWYQREASHRSEGQGERCRRIRETANSKAARRGFDTVREWQDWLEAECEIDALDRSTVLPRVAGAVGSMPAPRRHGEVIEHRLGRRIDVWVPVGLHLADGGCFGGFARDLGPDGMFVETAADPGDCRCLTVRLDTARLAGRPFADVPVFVVHRQHDGLGLLFRRLDQTATAVVKNLRNPAARDVAVASSEASSLSALLPRRGR